MRVSASENHSAGSSFGETLKVGVAAGTGIVGGIVGGSCTAGTIALLGAHLIPAAAASTTLAIITGWIVLPTVVISAGIVCGVSVGTGTYQALTGIFNDRHPKRD